MTVAAKRYCGANKRQGEGTCTRPPGWGTDHAGWGPCKLHGGGSPDVAGLVIEQQGRELFGKIAPEVVPVDNPLAAYAEFAGRVVAWMQLMDSLLGELSSVEVTTAAQGEQVRATVQAFERSMDRVNTVLASYARLNIDTRLASITEQQAKTVMRAVEAVIVLLAADERQATEARALASRHLRAV